MKQLIMRISFFLISMLIFSVICYSKTTFAGDVQVGHITISDPWARYSFAEAKSAAAYMTVKNQSGRMEHLIAVRSSIAQKVELHQTKSQNGILKMSLVNKLDIPAGKTIMLKPGGLHVMFFGLKKPIEEGATFPLTLEFSKAGKVTVMIRVLKNEALKKMNKHHHKH
tara:strand:- start:322 stop:825 length:504 start_codon:yes stop_codon:yes gene_type:complete